MNIKRAVITAAVSLLILALTAACMPGARKEQASTQTASRGALGAKEAYPIALAQAEKWRTNAYLDRVVMTIAADEIETGPCKITYHFIAPRALGPLRWWDSASIEVDSCERKVTEVATMWAGFGYYEMGPFQIEWVALDSPDALRIAEASGGREYREKHPDAQVRIEGARNWQPLNWYVRYFVGTEVPHDEVGFFVYAQSGQVERFDYELGR